MVYSILDSIIQNPYHALVDLKCNIEAVRDTKDYPR